jgi:hypothetical protein
VALQRQQVHQAEDKLTTGIFRCYVSCCRTMFSHTFMIYDATFGCADPTHILVPSQPSHHPPTHRSCPLHSRSVASCWRSPAAGL